MANCSICGRISATGSDHLDCSAKRAVDLEDEGSKLRLPERIDASRDAGDVAPEIRALLDHMAKEKGRSS